METNALEILVDEVSSGDQDAFQKLCELKYSAVFYQAFTILGNYHDAEDVSQNVMIIMFEKIGKLKSSYAFSAWMQTTVTNECRNYMRKKKNRRDDIPYEEESDLRKEDTSDWLPEQKVEGMEFESLLSQIIDKLSPKRKRIITLYYYEEFSYKEISDVMNISINTVSTNMMRAKEFIKMEMKRIADFDLLFEDEEQNDG